MRYAVMPTSGATATELGLPRPVFRLRASIPQDLSCFAVPSRKESGETGQLGGGCHGARQKRYATQAIRHAESRAYCGLEFPLRTLRACRLRSTSSHLIRSTRFTQCYGESQFERVSLGHNLSDVFQRRLQHCRLQNHTSLSRHPENTLALLEIVT